MGANQYTLLLQRGEVAPDGGRGHSQCVAKFGRGDRALRGQPFADAEAALFGKNSRISGSGVESCLKSIFIEQNMLTNNHKVINSRAKRFGD